MVFDFMSAEERVIKNNKSEGVPNFGYCSDHVRPK